MVLRTWVQLPSSPLKLKNAGFQVFLFKQVNRLIWGGIGMAGFSREDIIKSLPSPVVVVVGSDGSGSYQCPGCGRSVDFNQEKCIICSQTLSWSSLLERQAKQTGHRLKGTVTFDLPGDFTKGNCRKCPISYISKTREDNVYTCPLTGKHQEDCPVVVEKIDL